MIALLAPFGEKLMKLPGNQLINSIIYAAFTQVCAFLCSKNSVSRKFLPSPVDSWTKRICLC